MKAKKLMGVLCLMLGLAAFSIGTAQAAITYVTATVSAAGAISNGSSYVILTDVNTASPAFPANSQMILDNSTLQANQFLAAALTAWASTGKVRVLVDAPAVPFSVIFGVACVNYTP